MDVSIIHAITDWSLLSHASDLVQMSHGHSSIHLPVLAQTITDPDVLGQIQKAFNNFIKSGQLWAFLFGLFLGYLLRGITA